MSSKELPDFVKKYATKARIERRNSMSRRRPRSRSRSRRIRSQVPSILSSGINSSTVSLSDSESRAVQQVSAEPNAHSSVSNNTTPSTSQSFDAILVNVEPPCEVKHLPTSSKSKSVTVTPRGFGTWLGSWFTRSNSTPATSPDLEQRSLETTNGKDERRDKSNKKATVHRLRRRDLASSRARSLTAHTPSILKRLSVELYDFDDDNGAVQCSKIVNNTLCSEKSLKEVARERLYMYNVNTKDIAEQKAPSTPGFGVPSHYLSSRICKEMGLHVGDRNHVQSDDGSALLHAHSPHSTVTRIRQRQAAAQAYARVIRPFHSFHQISRLCQPPIDKKQGSTQTSTLDTFIQSMYHVNHHLHPPPLPQTCKDEALGDQAHLTLADKPAGSNSFLDQDSYADFADVQVENDQIQEPNEPNAYNDITYSSMDQDQDEETISLDQNSDDKIGFYQANEAQDNQDVKNDCQTDIFTENSEIQDNINHGTKEDSSNTSSQGTDFGSAGSKQTRQEISSSGSQKQKQQYPEKERILSKKWQALLDERESNMSARKISLQYNEQVHQLIREGPIPSCLRVRIWCIMSGVDEEKTLCNYQCAGGYYDKLVGIAELHGYPEAVEIQKDLHRTLPSYPLFRTKEGCDSLFRVLSAFCLRNPTIGYCQSMNSIAGVFLLLTDGDEETAFWLLTCLVESRRGYYTRSMASLMVDQKVLKSLFAFKCPRLFDHLARHGICITVFSTAWFLCQMMGTILCVEDCIVAWDYLFLYGDEFIFQMILAIVSIKESELLSLNQDDHLMHYMMHGGLRVDLDINKVLSSLSIGSLTNAISDLRTSHTVEVLRAHRYLPKSLCEKLLNEFELLMLPEQIQNMWKKFIYPSPWKIVLTSCIDDIIWFELAFAGIAFSPHLRKTWRDQGLCAGALKRLFYLFDVSHSSRLSFRDFIRGVYIFKFAPQPEKLKFVFQFFDLDEDNYVNETELAEGIFMLEIMKKGDCSLTRANAISIAEQMFDKARSQLEEKEEKVDTNASATATSTRELENDEYVSCGAQNASTSDGEEETDLNTSKDTQHDQNDNFGEDKERKSAPVKQQSNQKGENTSSTSKDPKTQQIQSIIVSQVKELTAVNKLDKYGLTLEQFSGVITLHRMARDFFGLTK